MKIAIKVLTEWDRENVIPFFEKHFPECNKALVSGLIEIGYTFWLRADNLLSMDYYGSETPSNYTILQGVPQNMELPSSEPIKTREQELEECLRKCQTGYPLLRSILNLYKVLGGVDVSDETLKEIEQLLNK